MPVGLPVEPLGRGRPRVLFAPGCANLSVKRPNVRELTPGRDGRFEKGAGLRFFCPAGAAGPVPPPSMVALRGALRRDSRKPNARPDPQLGLGKGKTANLLSAYRSR
jgi:hypothetical protein